MHLLFGVNILDSEFLVIPFGLIIKTQERYPIIKPMKYSRVLWLFLLILPMWRCTQSEASTKNIDPQDTTSFKAVLNRYDDNNRMRFLKSFRDSLVRELRADRNKAAETVEPLSEGGYMQKMLYNRLMIEDSSLLQQGLVDTLQYKNHRRLTPDQNVNVFGWHPYWMHDAYQSYNYELLTIVSFFSYDINPYTGGYRNVEAIMDWKRSEIVTKAHEKGCKVLLTVSLHEANNNKQFFNSDFYDVQQPVIDSVIALIQEKGADGVDLNFENTPSSCGAAFTRFTNALVRQLKDTNPSYTAVLTLPAYDYQNVYDLSELSNEIDLYVMMGYAFNTPESETPGPVAPLYTGTEEKEGLNLASAVDLWLGQGIPATRFLLGLPYYGVKWQTVGNQSTFRDFLTYREIRSLQDSLGAERLQFDSSSLSNYYMMRDPEGGTAEIWWDSEQALSAKYDWVIQKKLGGIGIWALGYDNGYPELWQLIDNKFTEIHLPVPNRINSTIIREVRQYGNVIVAGVVFLLGFIIFGFVVALFDWKVREVMFHIQAFRVFMFSIGVACLLAIMIYTDLISHQWVMVILVLLTVVAIYWILKTFANKYRSTLP